MWYITFTGYSPLNYLSPGSPLATYRLSSPSPSFTFFFFPFLSLSTISPPLGDFCNFHFLYSTFIICFLLFPSHPLNFNFAFLPLYRHFHLFALNIPFLHYNTYSWLIFPWFYLPFSPFPFQSHFKFFRPKNGTESHLRSHLNPICVLPSRSIFCLFGSNTTFSL